MCCHRVCDRQGLGGVAGSREGGGAALVFNNGLDNGEPDERSLHEGVAPTKGVKYAINGWVRAKHLYD